MARKMQQTITKTQGQKEEPPATPQASDASLILPYLARYSDITALVEYLKKKPLGATQAEVQNVLGPEAFDWRKVEVYRLTGFFNMNGMISLSQMGVEYAQANEDRRRELVWSILKGIRPYNGLLEWGYFQKKAQLDAEAVRLKWSAEYPEIDRTNKQRFDLAPIFFFSLCEGVGLGSFITGRKGQPTRLEIDGSALEAYVSYVPERTPVSRDAGPERLADALSSPPLQPPALGVPAPAAARNVLISHGKNRGPLADVEEMLKIMGLQPKVAIREPNLARPVSEKVRSTMKECSAAVFVFTPDETLTDSEGKRVFKPSENVLHELGAASVLYDDKVVILKEKSIQLPSNVSGLAHIPFDMENVKATFMDLYKELKGFGLL
jgi:hypothetical protein